MAATTQTQSRPPNTPGPVSSHRASPLPPPGPRPHMPAAVKRRLDNLNRLQDITGLSRNKCVEMLEISQGDVDMALEILMYRHNN